MVFYDVQIRHLAEVILQMFVVVFTSSLDVRILLAGRVLQAHLVDMLGNLAVVEVVLEVRVRQRVVVRQRHLADVVVGHKRFLRLRRGQIVASTHSIKLKII